MGTLHNFIMFFFYNVTYVYCLLMFYPFVSRMHSTNQKFRLECSHFNHTIAVYAKVRGDFVLVGDLLRSLSVIQVSTPSLYIFSLSPSLFHSLSNSSSVRGDFVLVKELLRFLEFRYLLSLFVLLVFLLHAP